MPDERPMVGWSALRGMSTWNRAADVPAHPYVRAVPAPAPVSPGAEAPCGNECDPWSPLGRCYRVGFSG